MTKNKIWLHIKPQIIKQLAESLIASRARFELVTYRNEITIYDATNFRLVVGSTDQYCLEILTENNTKMIGIAVGNVIEFSYFPV